MARATVTAMLATLFLGAALVISSGVVGAANECKKACNPLKKECFTAAKADFVACKQSAADKTAKKQCKTDFVTAKKAATTYCKTTCKDKTATPTNPVPCSPSGAQGTG